MSDSLSADNAQRPIGVSAASGETSDPRALGFSAVFANAEPGRKGEILGAAADVFAARGYQAGSMRDIAGRVGVSEPALYRHFPGKEALFLELIRIVASRLRADAFAIIDSVSAARVREQLAAAFADRRQVIAAAAPLLRTVMTAAAYNPAFLAEFRAVMIQPVRVRLTEAAARLDAEFEISNADATRDARVRALMSLFVGYTISSFVLADEPDEAIAEAAVRVMGWSP